MSQHGYSDQELDEMFGTTSPQQQQEVEDEDEPRPYANGNGNGQAAAMMPLPPLEMIPLGQQQPATNGNLLTKPVLGMPLWLVGLGAIAAGGGAWWYFAKKKDVTSNDPEPSPEPESTDRSGWSPGRGAVARQLEKHFSRKGLKATVWDDAEAAKKKGVKHRSPLVTITSNGAKIDADKDIQKLCKREGLSVIAHEDGSLGLYPGSGKRAKKWEEYIDLLRDDGQTD